MADRFDAIFGAPQPDPRFDAVFGAGNGFADPDKLKSTVQLDAERELTNPDTAKQVADIRTSDALTRDRNRSRLNQVEQDKADAANAQQTQALAGGGGTIAAADTANNSTDQSASDVARSAAGGAIEGFGEGVRGLGSWGLRVKGQIAKALGPDAARALVDVFSHDAQGQAALATPQVVQNAGQAVTDAGQAVDVPADRRDKFANRVANTTGMLAGFIATAAVAPEAVTPELIGQGFDQIDQQMKAGGEKGNSASGLAAETAGGVAIAVMQQTGLGIITQNLALPIKSAIARGIASVAIKSGADAATFAAMDIVTNFASQLGIDPNTPVSKWSDALQGSGQAAATGGIAGAVLATVLGHYGRLRTGKAVGSPADNSIFGPNADNNTYGPAEDSQLGTPITTDQNGNSWLAGEDGRPQKFASHKEAAAWAVRNGFGHAFERGVLPDGSIGLTPVEQFHQPNASPLDVSTTQDMQAGAPLVTPEDHSSPLPTDLIQQGKGAMAADLELAQHNDILHANGAPPVGSDVAVTGGAFNGQGKVLGAFSVGDQANPQHGIRIGMDDGSTFEELFHDIKNGGLSIQQLVDKYLPETAANAPQSAAELPSTDLPAAAPLPVQRGGNAAGQAHLPADVVQGLVARGIPEVAARAAAAGTVAEAGGKETAVNTTSGAIGLGQWLGSRKDALIARYGPNPTREQQIDFLAYELKGGDPGGKAVLSATNEADALHAYITQFMRPAKGHETDSDLQRGAAALGGGSVGAPSSATSDTSASTNDQAEEPIQFDKLQVPEEQAVESSRKAAPEQDTETPTASDFPEQFRESGMESVAKLKELAADPTNLAGLRFYRNMIEDTAKSYKVQGSAETGAKLLDYADRLIANHPQSEPRLGSEEQRTATQPTPTITPFGEAKPGDVVNEHGQTLLRADFKTPQEAGLWRSSNKVVGTVEGYDANGNTRYAVVSKTAPPSEDRYTPFDPALGSLGIPRAEMPQIKSEDRSAFVQFARGQGVDYKEEEVAPTDLKPSQAEYSPAKVEQAIGFTGGDRAILVSSDNYVVDGHHQWVAALRKGDQSVRVIRLDAPIRDVLKTAHEFPSSQSTDKPQSIILPNGKERSLVNKAALGPLFADPATDIEKYAILNAASEGRHRWKDAITSHSNWMMREGYATPVKDKAGSLQLTDEGHAELARVSAAREQAISAQIAASKPFEPMDHIPAMKKLVGETNISLGNLPAVAQRLGLKPDEAHKVLGKLASMPNSGIFQTKGRPASGKKKAIPPRFQRHGKRTTPLHLMEFIRSIGGVRNDEGHDLRNTGDIARFPGVINNKSGMSLDRLGEALHEAGYFNDRNQSDPTKRPDTAEIIDLLEKGSHSDSRVYANDDLTRVQELQEQQSNADDEERHREDLRDVARESGLDVTEAEIDHALHNYVAYGESHEYAIAAAVRDAAAETFEHDAELLGNDFYAKIAGELYEGEHAEQRGGSDAETVAQRQAQPTGEAGQDTAGQEPAGAERSANNPEQAQHPEQAKVESAPADELAPRPTDTRDHLQRKADERLIPAKEQKPVGSDGGLFDTQDTTGDLFAAENPLEDRLRGILDAIESPHGRYGMASVQWQKEIQPRDDILYELGQKPLDASRTAEDEYRQYLGKDRAAAIEQAAKDLAAGKIDRPKALATITDADLRKVQDGRQAAQDEFAYGRTKELADAGNEQAKKALATLDAKKAAPTATQSELKDVGEKIGSARKEDDLAAPRASAVDAPRAPFYSALEKSVEANPTKRASAEQWLATLKRAPGVKQDELDWSGVEDWLKMQEGPVDKEALLGVVRDGGIKVDEVVLSGDPNVEPMDVADATQRQAEVEADAALGEEATDEQRRDWIDSNWGRIQDQQEAMLQQEAGDAQFQGWSSDPSNKTYRELLITLPLGEGGNPQRAPATHWDQEAVVAHARFMDKTDAEGKRVLFIEEVQSDWHQKGRDQGYDSDVTEEEKAEARKQTEAAATRLEAANKAVIAKAPEVLEEWRKVVTGLPSGFDESKMSETGVLRKRAYEQIMDRLNRGATDGGTSPDLASDIIRFVRNAAFDPLMKEEFTEYNDAHLALNEAVQRERNMRERGIPDAPFKATWPALVMKRIVKWAVDNSSPASPAFSQVTQPESARVVAEDFFGAGKGAVPTLNAVDAGVLAALKNDKISRAVAANLPVDVVNTLARANRSPDQLLSKPNMVIPALPVDERGRVFDGLLSAARDVVAGVRTELAASRSAGRDRELLPALKASELNSRVIVGLLSPQLIYHDAAALGSDVAGVAETAAVQPARGIGRVADSQLDAAALADFLNWHDRLNGRAGTSYQAPSGYDKVAWTTGEEQAERYNLASTVDKIDVQKVSGEYRVRFGERQRIESLIVERGLARWDSRGNYAGAVVMTADQVSEVFGKDLGGRMMTEAGAAKNGEMVTLEGNGLKLGGEGMKAFYDRNLVNMTNDIIKKHGAKVEKVDLGSHSANEKMRRETLERNLERANGLVADPDQPREVRDRAAEAKADAQRRLDAIDAAKYANPGFTITDKLREAATGGFPLFNVGGIRVRFSPEQMQQFAKELPAALKALGVEDRIALRLGVSADLAHQGTQGQYWNRVVTIAMDKADDPYRVLVHEVGGHGLKALGLYTPTEWKILTDGAWADKDIRAWAQRNYPGKSEEYQKEEAASEWLADRAAAARDVKNDKSFMGRMLHRLIQFISAVRRALRKLFGKGEEAGDIARKVFSGEVGARPTGFGEAPRDRTGFGNKGLLPDENGKRIQQELEPRSSVTDSITPAAPKFDPETEKRWQEANGLGVHGPGLIANAKVGLQHFVEGWARHYEHLPNSARFADVTQQLRKLEGAPEAAYEKVVRGLTQLVGKLTPEEYDVLKRKAVVDDLMWEADREHQLPFGFTPESLRAARANLDSIAQTMPKVTEALRQRKLANRQLADALVESGVLRSDQIKNPAYYRHQVLDYARAQVAAAKNGETMIVGGKSVRVRMPWWAKREGSTLDINSNLLEAEADWMLKAHTDIQTAKTLNWIKASEHNIRDQLRTRAKGENDEGYAKALLTNEEAAKQDGKLRGMTKRGFDVVKSVLEGTDLNIPPELQGAADAILNDKKGESVFPLLSWLMDEKKPGANGAALILAGIGGRKKLMRQLLGMKYANAEDIAELVQRYKPEGYKAWQPTPGQHLFTAKTVSEHVLDMFAEKLNEQTYPGVDKAELERALGQIKPQLVVGGDRYTMVIPSEIADTLTEWGDKGSHNQFLQAVAKLQGAWKQYTLVNPRRWFKYNFNNMTGDLDAIVAGKPGSLMKVPQAFRELYAISRGGAASDAYKEALERGVFQAGITRQEVPDIARFKGLRHLERQKSSLRPDRLAVQTVANIWGALKDSTQFRETLFRYATYLKYREEIAAGVDQAKIGYGGSNPALVDAVTDPADRAALLARELVGDYGNVSLFGQRMRRYVMPFWSWPEINTKRYYRLTANAFHTSYARGAAVGGGLGVLTGARVGVSLMIRMALVFSLINLWNEWLHGDDEAKLDDQQQRQLHLILGHDSKGQVYTLKMQGALSDVLDELGFSDTVEAFHNYDQGKGSFAEILEATPKAIVNRVGPGGWNPLYMEPIQLALREKLWPDMFQPRTIHDRTRDVAQTFSLENEYDAVEHKPSQGYGQSWVQSFAYKRDPGEMAYNNTRDLIGQWMKEHEGLDIGRADISPRSEALRDYKMALRFGDVDAAKRALQEYVRFDGTARGFKSSIKAAAPLHSLPKRDRAAFVNSLNDEQRDELIEAQRWFEETYLGRRP